MFGRLYKGLIQNQALENLWRKFVKQPGDGRIPLPLRTLLFLLRRFSPLQTMRMETVWRRLWMCRAIGWLLAWELLLLLRQEVAQPQAECLGRTQPPWQSCSIPCSSLVSPWVCAAPGAGFVPSSMVSLDALTRQQPWSGRGRGSHRWVSFRTHVWLGACFHFLLKKAGVTGEE